MLWYTINCPWFPFLWDSDICLRDFDTSLRTYNFEVLILFDRQIVVVRYNLYLMKWTRKLDVFKIQSSKCDKYSQTKVFYSYSKRKANHLIRLILSMTFKSINSINLPIFFNIIIRINFSFGHVRVCFWQLKLHHWNYISRILSYLVSEMTKELNEKPKPASKLSKKFRFELARRLTKRQEISLLFSKTYCTPKTCNKCRSYLLRHSQGQYAVESNFYLWILGEILGNSQRPTTHQLWFLCSTLGWLSKQGSSETEKCRLIYLGYINGNLFCQ